MGRFRRAINTVCGVALASGIIVANTRLYLPNGARYGREDLAPDVLPSLRFVGEALDRGAAERMQRLFPEGFVFQYATYGLAWVEVAMREPAGSALRQEAIAEVRRSLRRIESETGRAPFDPTLTPECGIFHAGWTNWLRGGLLRLTRDTGWQQSDAEAFRARSAGIARAFRASPTPFLEAYSGQAWPCDSVVAVASLRLHDSLFEPAYAEDVERWLAKAKGRLDPATGLLPHDADPETGATMEGARGSSQALIQRFLPEVDPEWAGEQYRLFREHFVAAPFSIPGIREYPRGVRKSGDVDSGPLLMGLSPSASVVAVGAALLHDDRTLAEPVLHGVECLGVPVGLGRTKRYVLGAFPVLDSFLAWSKTARPCVGAPTERSWRPIAPWWWRLPVHGVSLMVLLIVRRTLRRREPALMSPSEIG